MGKIVLILYWLRYARGSPLAKSQSFVGPLDTLWTIIAVVRSQQRRL
ncbi:hypothetical protein [Novosphingobium sp. Rr 2-17]|nr:hypothetical protein [Novosphingobium sp. Rr 2-17]